MSFISLIHSSLRLYYMIRFDISSSRWKNPEYMPKADSRVAQWSKPVILVKKSQKCSLLSQFLDVDILEVLFL